MSQPIDNEAEPTQEWGIMILLDLVGSTSQGLIGSDEELREYHRRRIEHVTACARTHGIERLDDQGDADLLFLLGDQPEPLLELFHDLNSRNPVPDYLHFQPVFRMVAHYNKFAFSPRDAQGLRKQLSSNHLTLQFRFEKACPARALLMTRMLYERVRDKVPDGWLQCKKNVPPKLKEWLTITGDEIYWLGLPADDLQTKVDVAYGKLCDEAQAPMTIPTAATRDITKSEGEPSKRESQSLFVNLILDIVILVVAFFAFWQGMSDNWHPSLLLPVSFGLKGVWIIWDLAPGIRILTFTAVVAIVVGSTILVGNLVAKKPTHSAWWTAGGVLFAFGAGMAMVLAVMQSRRGDSHTP